MEPWKIAFKAEYDALGDNVDADTLYLISDATISANYKTINGEIIPEFKCDAYLEVSDGAQLIEIGKDGTETLKAVYSEVKGMFIPVE